ncbi:hypothetical protein CCACVL1_08174 [Corchorus capsularis]|uniref:Uncharacterized protein n=1 Tax=Corchorus capsularis TaxID=210143 RepID=A0A1R3J1Y2_COCAP|nr:hypothetical protein CCACVL1_08174 [Corchorus capsularis]
MGSKIKGWSVEWRETINDQWLLRFLLAAQARPEPIDDYL